MASATELSPSCDQPLVLKGRLEEGKKLPSLEWAANSSVACFPMTRASEFTGSHVFYSLLLPANSTLRVSVRATNSKDRINVYGLRFAAGTVQLPPIERCGSAEASYAIYVGDLAPGLKKEEERAIEFMTVRNPFTIVIGVAGANGLEEGEFQLEVNLKKRG